VKPALARHPSASARAFADSWIIVPAAAKGAVSSIWMGAMHLAGELHAIPFDSDLQEREQVFGDRVVVDRVGQPIGA